MASVDELSAAVGAGKESIEQTTAAVSAAMSGAEELSSQFSGLGAEDKAGMAMQVKESLEQIQAGLQSVAQAAEQAQAQAESLRGLEGSTGGGVSAGNAGEGVPAPAGGSGDSKGPTDPPTSSPPVPAAPGDEPDRRQEFEFIPWFPDEVSADRFQNRVGNPVEPPEEIDPADESRRSRFRRIGRTAVRSADDLRGYSNQVEKSKNDLGDLFKPPPDPHSYPSSTGTQDPPVLTRPVGGDDTPDPTDIVGTSIMMGAAVLEATSRLVRRKDER